MVDPATKEALDAEKTLVDKLNIALKLYINLCIVHKLKMVVKYNKINAFDQAFICIRVLPKNNIFKMTLKDEEEI